MKIGKSIGWTMLALGGLSISLVQAQPYTPTEGQVNVSGATLFRNFFKSPAATNDFIDADQDGLSGFFLTPPFVDQLAPSVSPPGAWTGPWLVNYRGVGSGNGVAEFVDFQLCGTIPTSIPAEAGFINRFEYADLGSITWGGPFCNASGTPECLTSIDVGVTDVPGLLQYAQGTSASAAWNRRPGSAGYGLNPLKSVGNDCVGKNQSNQLKTLCRDCDGAGPNPEVCLNTNTGCAADANTVFDNPICWTPIAYLANRGVGLPDRDPLDGKVGGDIKTTELQYVFVTGRMPNGENLVACTRDVGSGTRNGAMNSIGIDPSFGRGDNLYAKLGVETYANLGPHFQPTHCGSSGIQEKAVQNNRLGIGYAGLAGASRAAADALAGRYEILNVMRDIDANGDLTPDGSHYVRPTIDTVLDNADPDTGWQAGGAQTFITRGSPFAGVVKADFDVDNDVDVGDFVHFQACFNGPDNPYAGPGCADADFDCDGDVDVEDFVTFQVCFNGPDNPPSPACPANPVAMSNQAAAAYLRNIILSSAAFAGDPGRPEDQNMPGEYLAVTFFLNAGIDALPLQSKPELFVAQSSVNTILQEYMRANNGLEIGGDTPDYGSVNDAGLVPVRNSLNGYVPPKTVPPCPQPPAAYADGSVTGEYYYKDSAGTTQNVTGALRLSQRNEVAGDFNRDGKRNLDDVCTMMQAVKDPLEFEQTGCAYCTNHVPSGGWGGSVGGMIEDVVIAHVIGDFNGDGNFDAADVRYFGDGLAMTTGGSPTLDRKAGFTAVDTCWAGLPGGSGNYFGTTLATPKAYAAGDSRGDVAGGTPFKGAYPNGADGTVNAADIDYVCANFGDWSDLDVAEKIDLSCDMNGDLVVDADDVTELVTIVLGTTMGDVNLDGTTDCADVAIVRANLGGSGWANGDVNGDGTVTAADEDAIEAILGSACP